MIENQFFSAEATEDGTVVVLGAKRLWIYKIQEASATPVATGSVGSCPPAVLQHDCAAICPFRRVARILRRITVFSGVCVFHGGFRVVLRSVILLFFIRIILIVYSFPRAFLLRAMGGRC